MMTNDSETVLLAVTGMSPAVLTETVWALATEAEPVAPQRVVVVTTTEGKAAMERDLFTPLAAWGGQTVWQTLRDSVQQRLGLAASEPVLNFEPVRVFTIPDPKSGRATELADLRTRSDNDFAADFLLEQVRGLVENPDTHVIASLAGGRKTMGALLYACLTLVGRGTDRLTHVLVNEPYDTVPGFWYPGQPGGTLIRPARGKSAAIRVEPADATVELADVPFVPLRNLFLRELGQPAGTFRRLMDLCRNNIRRSAGEHLQIEIDRSRPETRINGRRLELAPREQLVLLFFAERAKRGDIVLSAYDEVLNDLEEARIAFRAEAPPKNWSDWRHSSSLNRKLDERDLTRVLSDIRRKAKQAGGDAAFLADVLPERGRVALDVPGPVIFIKP